jgi:hypothetical protein
MTALAKEYSFIAYSIGYKVSMQVPSFALDRDDPPQLRITFFPFRRQFFHRAESALDSLLMVEMKKLAKAKGFPATMAEPTPMSQMDNTVNELVEEVENLGLDDGEEIEESDGIEEEIITTRQPRQPESQPMRRRSVGARNRVTSKKDPAPTETHLAFKIREKKARTRQKKRYGYTSRSGNLRRLRIRT